MEELDRKQNFLQKELRIKNVQYSWSDSRASFLEAVFARGDRRLGKVIKKAWQKGCIFDGWAELFNDTWMEAFEEEGIDPTSMPIDREMLMKYSLII